MRSVGFSMLNLLNIWGGDVLNLLDTLLNTNACNFNILVKKHVMKDNNLLRPTLHCVINYHS